MRIDVNHAGNKQYAATGFAHKCRPDVAETHTHSMMISSVERATIGTRGRRMNMTKPRNCGQESWQINRGQYIQQYCKMTMSDQVSRYSSMIIQHKWHPGANQTYKYLAQLYNISPHHSRGNYCLHLEPWHNLSKAEGHTETAHTWFKEKKIFVTNDSILPGYARQCQYTTEREYCAQLQNLNKSNMFLLVQFIPRRIKLSKRDRFLSIRVVNRHNIVLVWPG